MQLAALCLVLGTYGFAADDAYLYIVHGIPGRDIASTANPGFPVDVLINGETCIPRNAAYGIVYGPYNFSPGKYEVLISATNTLAPCTNPPIISSEVTLAGGASVSAVAALTGGQPTLLQFTDSLTAVTAGDARFVFTNTADAPALQATLTQVGVAKPKVFIVTASPGKQEAINIPYGTYLVTVVASGSTAVLATEEMVLANQSVTFTYAAGESANSSVGLFNKAVLAVF